MNRRKDERGRQWRDKRSSTVYKYRLPGSRFDRLLVFCFAQREIVWRGGPASGQAGRDGGARRESAGLPLAMEADEPAMGLGPWRNTNATLVSPKRAIKSQPTPERSRDESPLGSAKAKIAGRSGTASVWKSWRGLLAVSLSS